MIIICHVYTVLIISCLLNKENILFQYTNQQNKRTPWKIYKRDRNTIHNWTSFIFFAVFYIFMSYRIYGNILLFWLMQTGLQLPFCLPISCTYWWASTFKLYGYWCHFPSWCIIDYFVVYIAIINSILYLFFFNLNLLIYIYISVLNQYFSSFRFHTINVIVPIVIPIVEKYQIARCR